MRRPPLCKITAGTAARRLLSLTVAVVVAGAGIVRGAPGDFDASFAGGGWTDWPGAIDGAQGMSLQADGKIVVAGRFNAGLAEGLSVWRFDRDGRADLSFNSGGQAGFGDNRTIGRHVLLHPDGRILVAGTYYAWNMPSAQYTQALFLPDGQRDLSFGGAGNGFSVIPSFGTSVTTLLPDGRILAAGTSAPPVLKRWLPDGTPDPSFGFGGTLNIPAPPAGARGGRDFAFQSDGKILMASEGDPFTLTRLFPNGVLDTAFGTGGATVIPAQTMETECRRVIVLPDGKILAAGFAGPGLVSSRGLILARFLPDGSMDTSFGDPAVFGPVVVLINMDFNFVDMVVQRDGRIILVGTTNPGITLMRFTADGLPDHSFGAAGRVSYALQTARAAALQPDEKLVVAGMNYNTSDGTRILLARFLTMPDNIGLAVENASGAAVPAGGTVDFGPVTGGTRLMELTVRNTGHATLTNLQAALTGESNPGDYHLTPSAAATLPRGGATTLLVSLKPSAAPGLRTATLRLTSGNTAPSLTPVTVSLTGSKATPLQTWRYTWFGSADNSGDGADTNDFDRDGLPNFMEYATLSDPHHASPSPLLPSPHTPGAFTWTRPAAALTEFSCLPESAPSPAGPWSPAGLTSTILTDDGTVQTVQVTPAITPLPTRLFLRLRVTKL